MEQLKITYKLKENTVKEMLKTKNYFNIFMVLTMKLYLISILQ